MSTFTLHGFAGSTYTRTARMAALEKGVSPDLASIAYGKPEHLALHPFGKMPILTHGETKVYETLAIVGYLDGQFAGARLIPESAEPRAKTFAAISIAIDYAYQPIVHVKMIDDKPDPNQAAAGARVLDWLEDQLSTAAYLAGARLTAADLFFAPMLAHHLTVCGETDVLGPRPRLAKWFGSMNERASFVETAAD